jgi:hypothetical protein
MNNDDLWNTWKLLLVGGIPTPLKNMSSSNGIIIPNIWENKKWSKPPTRLGIMMIYESSSKKNGDWFVTDRKKIRRHMFFLCTKDMQNKHITVHISTFLKIRCFWWENDIVCRSNPHFLAGKKKACCRYEHHHYTEIRRMKICLMLNH